MGKQFEGGVKWYTHGYAQINFPENAVCCRFCPCLRSDAGGAQHRCPLSGAILYNIDELSDRCPIIIMEEDKHE